MYIVKLKLKTTTLGHICDGFVHRNKSGKYYSDAEHAFVFTNIFDALASVESISSIQNPKYTLLSWELCDLMNSPVKIDKNFVIGDLTGLKAVIGSIFDYHLKDKVDMTRFDYAIIHVEPTNEIMIRFMNNSITISKSGFKVSSNPITGTPLSKKVIMTLTDELLQDLLVVTWNFMNGCPVDMLTLHKED